MYKLSDLIGDYEEAVSITVPGLRKELPIESPANLDWNLQQNPTRLSKMYKINQEEKYNAFIVDLLEHQAETQHHARITMQFPQVKIEVWTHTLGDITEVDIEWAQAVNEIYEGYNV